MNYLILFLILIVLVISFYLIKKMTKIAIMVMKIGGLIIIFGILLIILAKMFPDSSLADATAYIIKIIK